MSEETASRVCLSQRAHWAAEQAISFLMAQGVENRDVISLAAGLVDEQTLPVALCRDLLNELLSDDRTARGALQYGTTPGAEALRSEVLKHLARLEGGIVDDLGVAADQVVLSTGSQQLLTSLADVLLDPGDICLVSAPTYFVFLGVLNGVGARTVAIPSDDQGMRIDLLADELERIAARGELNRVKLIYVVSDFENPSGISLSAARRQQVVDLAKRWSTEQRIFVLEDAAYRELRYEGEPLPSVWSFDQDRDTVILAQTFSKSFSPGVRVGFGVLPRELVAPVCNRKGNEDFGSAHLNQQLLNLALKSGRYQQHVQQVCQGYRSKRDAFLAALATEFRDLPEVHWVHPKGGLYVWMTLPDAVATGFNSTLFQSAVKEHKVMFVPGELGYPSTRNEDVVCRNQMRLSFGVQPVDGLQEGARRLAAAVRQQLR
ncbi:aminotransferase class I/II-fold pyridoxal phosphate-dependent enzyme [bacterium]|nr:aminotransferase class I/II-fold pyridoxal phosphate-dependent enzyme [bacterium]